MKYYIKTFGCQMNVSDSERIAGFLEAQKLKPVEDIKKADLIIFNTCGVRQMAEDRVYGQIHNIKKQESGSKKQGKKKIIILTGCLANRPDVQRRLKDKVDLFVPIEYFFKIKNFSTTKCDYLQLLPKYSNKFSAYIPIMTGCNNFCAYCVVPYARGKEWSRPKEDIFKEIGNLSKNNYQEITLLGQNVNSYSYKIVPILSSSRKRGSSAKIILKDWIPACAGMTKITFPLLFDSIAKSFPQINFKFLTSHPKDFSEDLINVIAKNKNIFREIHLPLQAGSDKILRAMNRPYTQKHYLGLIQKARKKIPSATFTTDVIVGFPGETQKDFQETIKVFKKVNYNEAYINKYSPRPGTAAWKLGNPISWKEKKRREKILRKLIRKTKKLNDKIIAILGPTSSGKSEIAIKLAEKFNGEIISADSRQIYRGMDISTGKITKLEQKKVKHWMLDIVSPKTNFSAAQFKKIADKIIADIIARGKLPIICGGTGFWIKAIVDNVTYPEVKPDWKLREKLGKKSAKELFKMLKRLDPVRAKDIDAKNKVRLIRTIEICNTLGKVPAEKCHPELVSGSQEMPKQVRHDIYDFFQIGLKLSKEELHKNIEQRLEKRFQSDMIEEVRRLHQKDKIGWKRLESFGLGYFWIPKYLKGEIASKKELFEKVYLAEKDYAKRQMTWFRKDKRIIWLEKYAAIEKEVKKFLNKI